MIECLKQTGMPIQEINQFCQWVQQGDASLQQRYEMFQERRKVVQEQMEQSPCFRHRSNTRKKHQT